MLFCGETVNNKEFVFMYEERVKHGSCIPFDMEERNVAENGRKNQELPGLRKALQ